MEVIILAGGLGTRLKDTVFDVPKVMADINGKPFLEYIFEYLKEQGIKKVVLSVGYKKQIIQQYFKNTFKSIEIIYSEEHEPLGTGGALKKAFKYIKGNKALVLNGDTFFNIHLEDFFKKIRFSSKVSIALKKMKDSNRYGHVNLNKENIIISFVEKQYIKEAYINAGLYLVDKDIFHKIKAEKFSFEKFLEENLNLFSIQGITFSNSYFIDIGIPEDYFKAQKDFKELF